MTEICKKLARIDSMSTISYKANSVLCNEEETALIPIPLEQKYRRRTKLIQIV